MDPLTPGPPPAVRVTILLRLVSEGFQDAFGSRPAWLEAPAGDVEELRAAVGEQRARQVAEAAGLRAGSRYAAGGPQGTVTLSPAALAGVLGLMGLAALPADVIVEETPDGPRYSVPDDWFVVERA